MLTPPIKISQPLKIDVPPLPSSSTTPTFCSKSFIYSILNPREILCPFTFKKAAYWATTAGFISGITYLEINYGLLSEAIHYDSLYFMSAIYLYEPLMQTVSLLLAKYPKANEFDPVEATIQYPRIPLPKPYSPVAELFIRPTLFDTESSSPEEEKQLLLSLPSPGTKMRYKLNIDVAIVITCHDSEEVIEKTVASCLKHVYADQIYLVDNSDSEQPTDKTRDIVRKIDSRIHYIWSHRGNKTVAEYLGAYCAMQNNILTLDDDCLLPHKLKLNLEVTRINDKVKAVCFPVRPIHPKGERSLLVEEQDIEYQLSDLAKLAQDQYAGGVSFPHGAVCLWEKLTFLKLLKKHDTVFFAEDVKLGLLLQNLGFKMEIAAGCWFDTEAPISYFGKSPNLYEQRVRSWEMGRHIYFFKFLKALLTVWKPSFSLNCVMKSYQLYDVYSNISDWLRVPLFIYMGGNPQFWIRLAELNALSLLPTLSWNYIKLPLNGRKDLQVPLRACLALPFYKTASNLMAFGGALRALFIYLPNYKPKPTIDKIIESETENKNKLETELEKEPRNGPITFKRILYHDRFFMPKPLPPAENALREIVQPSLSRGCL